MWKIKENINEITCGLVAGMLIMLLLILGLVMILDQLGAFDHPGDIDDAPPLPQKQGKDKKHKPTEQPGIYYPYEYWLPGMPKVEEI